MFTKLKTLLFTVSATLLLLVPTVALPLMAHADSADISNNLCEGSSLNFQESSTACGGTSDSTTKISSLVAVVINVFSVVVAIIAVIMIIIGGIRYVTSGGNDQSVASAKNTILYAIIGLVVVALAQIVVRYVLNRVSGA